MNELNRSRITEINDYWLVYRKDSGEPGHMYLGACASRFGRQEQYESGDGLRCVGKRYEKDGFGCYELYSLEHTLIKCPLRPNVFQAAAALLRGKKPAEAQREAYLDFEAQLNAHGYKTIE